MSGYFAARQIAQQRLRIRILMVSSLVLFLFGTFASIAFLGDSNSKVTTIITKIPGMEFINDKTTTLIPVEDIASGTRLEPLMFRVEELPKSHLAKDVITSFDQLNGLYANGLILSNHPIRIGHTSRSPSVNEVTNRIPEGFRGVTIRVDELSGVEGWARPGARVDVSWISNVGGKQTLTVIVQNSLIMSAGRNVNGDYPQGAPAPPEMTLLVTKEDARRIILGQQTGSLNLSLRGAYDIGKGGSSAPITTDDLLGRPTLGQQIVKFIVVGVREYDGELNLYHWKDPNLIPTNDKGTLF